jgi:hypothetical protein
MLSTVRQVSCISVINNANNCKRNGTKKDEEVGHHTSLICTVVSGIAIGIVEK